MPEDRWYHHRGRMNHPNPASVSCRARWRRPYTSQMPTIVGARLTGPRRCRCTRPLAQLRDRPWGASCSNARISQSGTLGERRRRIVNRCRHACPQAQGGDPRPAMLPPPATEFARGRAAGDSLERLDVASLGAERDPDPERRLPPGVAIRDLTEHLRAPGRDAEECLVATAAVPRCRPIRRIGSRDRPLRSGGSDGWTAFSMVSQAWRLSSPRQRITVVSWPSSDGRRPHRPVLAGAARRPQPARPPTLTSEAWRMAPDRREPAPWRGQRLRRELAAHQFRTQRDASA